jgi:fructokinase
MTFLVCGEALWDLFAVDDASGLHFEARTGGSPFNVAVGLARLDQRVALLAGLSTDPLGERLAAALEKEGVRNDYLVRTPRLTTLSMVDLNSDRSPAYAFYGSNGADRAINSGSIPPMRSEVWGLHFGSYSLVAEPVGSSLLSLAQQEAKQRLITLDPNIRLTVEPDVDVWRARVERFVGCADLVKVSAEDLSLLHPGEDAASIAQHWHDLGAVLIIVTKGAAGAEVFGPTLRIAAPGLPVPVVDTVGAGDSFIAALIAGLADRQVRTRPALEAQTDEDLAALLRDAIEASALTCGRRGADLPRRADLGLFSAERARW